MEYNLKKQKKNHYALNLKLTQYCKSIILQLKKKDTAANFLLLSVILWYEESRLILSVFYVQIYPKIFQDNIPIFHIELRAQYPKHASLLY